MKLQKYYDLLWSVQYMWDRAGEVAISTEINLGRGEIEDYKASSSSFSTKLNNA